MRMDCDPECPATSKVGWGCIVTTLITSVNAHVFPIHIQVHRLKYVSGGKGWTKIFLCPSFCSEGRRGMRWHPPFSSELHINFYTSVLNDTWLEVLSLAWEKCQ